jgi:3D (Asp-Asp-Asp) domain-containing protein
MLLFSAMAFLQSRTESLANETAQAALELSMRLADARSVGDLFAPSPEPRLFAVTVTAYSPTPDQTWGDPWTGAMGRRVRPGKTLAVSHDLKHLLGSRVYVEGVGYLVAEDLMHPRWENRVDLCLRTRDRAEAFGIKQLNMVVLD